MRTRRWFFHPPEGASARLRKAAAQPAWKDHMTRNLVGSCRCLHVPSFACLPHMHIAVQ
jgi:hypothetical protein